MKKVIAGMLIAAFLACSVGTSSAVNAQRGGIMGFIAGCCFGVRAGGAYNDGKEIHWREWVRLIPYVNIVFAIWDGVDGTNGMTSKDYIEKYGAMYY
ncbi:MAG: hypothetical protein V1913_09250 [Fibrobacterota bacterium]